MSTDTTISEQGELLLAFLTGMRAAAACWMEGDGAVTELQQPADYEVLLSAVVRYCYTDHMMRTLPERYQPVILELCGMLMAKVDEKKSGESGV